MALRFRVLELWVRRLKQERRKQGKIAPQLTRHRRKSGESQAKWLLAKLEERPDICLRELQATAQIELGWQVSDVTRSRACRTLRCTRKKDASSGRAAAARRGRSTARGAATQLTKLGPLCGQVRGLFTDTKCRNYIAHCGYRNT